MSISILIISALITGCAYSFVKGTLSVREYFLSGIENSSLNAELKQIMYDALIKQMKQYGNINIVEDKPSKDTLSAEIKDYKRKEDAYDVSGNILSYVYSINVDFIASSKKISVNTNKIFDAKLSESECKDSIVNESVKALIDKLRGDF